MGRVMGLLFRHANIPVDGWKPHVTLPQLKYGLDPWWMRLTACLINWHEAPMEQHIPWFIEWRSWWLWRNTSAVMDAERAVLELLLIAVLLRVVLSGQ